MIFKFSPTRQKLFSFVTSEHQRRRDGRGHHRPGPGLGGGTTGLRRSNLVSLLSNPGPSLIW